MYILAFLVALGLVVFYIDHWLRVVRDDIVLLIALMLTSTIILLLFQIAAYILAGCALVIIWFLGTRALDWLVGVLWARRIASDSTGELWRYPHPGEPIFRVIVHDGQGQHSLRVPPTMRSAREAVAWTYSMSADEYHPTVRT